MVAPTLLLLPFAGFVIAVEDMTRMWLCLCSETSCPPDTHTLLVTEWVSDGELFNHARSSAEVHFRAIAKIGRICNLCRENESCLGGERSSGHG